RITRIIEDRGNFVHISELGRMLGTSPAMLHDTLQRMRRAGLISVAGHEGRHGITPDEQRYLMRDHPGEAYPSLGYVMMVRRSYTGERLIPPRLEKRLKEAFHALCRNVGFKLDEE